VSRAGSDRCHATKRSRWCDNWWTRRIAATSHHAASSPIALLNRIFAAVREFCQQADQSDDMTVTVTRFV
jgi:hypothetical protein